MLGLTSFGQGGVVISPSDTVNQGPFRSLYVGGTGHVTLIGLDGNSVLFSAVPAGTLLNVGFMRVMSTGTTASLMTGIT
jgi:hypothetical protein